MPENPKHRDISRRLRADIAAGRYTAGARLPSEPQLVRQFGVSRPTVGRALLDLLQEGLIERRAGSGTYVKGGAPAQAASSTRQLGLLIPGLDTTEIFQLICGELASLARVHEYSLLWGGSTHPRQDTDASLEHAEELCQQFIERKVSGVFFAPYELMPEQEQANRRLAVSLRQAGIPVVLLDRDLLPFPIRSDFDLVGLDNMAGGYLLAEHLIKLGCRFLPDGLSGMTKALPNLAQQEAIFVGEGAALPARIRIRDLPEDKLPKSDTAKFARGWTLARLSEAEITVIAKRMVN